MSAIGKLATPIWRVRPGALDPAQRPDMKQLSEFAGLDCHPQFIQREELRANIFGRVRLRSLDRLNPTRKHMEAVGVSCRIGTEISACAPMAGTDSGFLKKLSLRCFQRIFPCFDDAPRQFHHHP